MSSPGGEPASQAAWAFSKAARPPPAKDPSPAQLASMGSHPPKGRPAAGAAVEAVDLLSQIPADAGASPSPAASQAVGPSATPAADAADPAASLAAMWPDGPAGAHAEMMQWAASELTSRRAAALRDKEALRAAQQQLAAAEDRLREVELTAQDCADIRWKRQERLAQLALRAADRHAQMAEYPWPWIGPPLPWLKRRPCTTTCPSSERA